MIAVVDLEMGNCGSVKNMLCALAADAVVTNDVTTIRNARKLVLPGVGTFDAGVRALHQFGIFDVICRRVKGDGVPVLGICLGMQLLGNRSEEGPGGGLGLIPAVAKRFSFSKERRPVPHMGWNHVRFAPTWPFTHSLDDEARFYFVHSYHVVCEEPADVAGVTEYGLPFTSVVRRGNVFGVQFHPEKSHRFGLALLGNFVRFQA